MPSSYDFVCLSHLRWNFVYQRPQHLFSRFARQQRVFFVEEPLALPANEVEPRLDISEPVPGVNVVVPRMPDHLRAEQLEALQRTLLAQLFADADIQAYVLWYYTPMAVNLARELPQPLLTIYDCMDQLSAFRGAPPELLLRELQLFRAADLVFTGGQTLYEAKRTEHPRVYAFPSAVDVAHFAQARRDLAEPSDQAGLPSPRLGFCGVLDERLDTDLLAEVADLRPHWQIVLVGPVAKIEEASLPRRPNIHYLGSKSYAELPSYLAGWDVALIPFAHNSATEFISPTKTPEYLAAGRPVVSTSIRDVVRPYGARGLAYIADDAVDFVAAIESALIEDASTRLERADQFLASISWERTWSAMNQLIDQSIEQRFSAPSARVPVAVG